VVARREHEGVADADGAADPLVRERGLRGGSRTSDGRVVGGWWTGGGRVVDGGGGRVGVVAWPGAAAERSGASGRRRRTSRSR